MPEGTQEIRQPVTVILEDRGGQQMFASRFRKLKGQDFMTERRRGRVIGRRGRIFTKVSKKEEEQSLMVGCHLGFQFKMPRIHLSGICSVFRKLQVRQELLVKNINWHRQQQRHWRSIQKEEMGLEDQTRGNSNV